MAFVLVSLLFGLALAAAIGTILATVLPEYERIRHILTRGVQPRPLPVQLRRARRHRIGEIERPVIARSRAAA
jgi:hypothetical protein